MDILWIGVCYNSGREAVEFARQLSRSGGSSTLQLVIVDNSDDSPAFDLRSELAVIDPRILYLAPKTNLGYFGGAHFALTAYTLENPMPQWVAVSNVDLSIKAFPFLDHLKEVAPDPTLGLPRAFDMVAFLAPKPESAVRGQAEPREDSLPHLRKPECADVEHLRGVVFLQVRS